MKLVDVWLIFAQVVPWIEVLLHTLIDWMRTEEEEEEGREVNHHGKAITVGGGKENTDKEMVNIGRHLFSSEMSSNTIVTPDIEVFTRVSSSALQCFANHSGSLLKYQCNTIKPDWPD